MRREHATAIAFLGTLMLGALSLTRPAPAADAKTVHVGLVNTLFRDESDKQIESMAGPFKSLMKEQAGVVGEVVAGGDWEQLAAKIKDGKVQLGAFNGFEYAWAKQKNKDLKVLMVGVNQQPYSKAVIVVRKDDKAADVAALKGYEVSLPQISRENTRLFLTTRGVPKGMAIDKFFSKVGKPRTPQDALDDLAEGTTQAAAVEDSDLEAFRKKFPKTAAKLRVLAESEKFPPAVVAYLPGALPEDTLKKLQTGMIDAKKTERGRKLLDLCRITGFEAVPADFEQVLMDILKAYPEPTK
jgi:ABC-type phosphate/phosphonate transport system substrate-binding protein